MFYFTLIEMLRIQGTMQSHGNVTKLDRVGFTSTCLLLVRIAVLTATWYKNVRLLRILLDFFDLAGSKIPILFYLKLCLELSFL